MIEEKEYCKTRIVSPGLIIICSKDFFAGLIFGGAYFRRGLLLEGFCVSNWVGLDNKKQPKTL